MRWILLAVTVAWTLAPEPAGAGLELDGADWHAELSAQTRLLWRWTREIEADDFVATGSTKKADSKLLLTRAEISAEAVWRDRLYAEFVYDMEYRTGSGLDSLRFAVGDEIGPGTWFDWEDEIHQGPNSDLRHFVYRAWLRYEGDRFDVTVGRQRIALGRGRIWNPVDLFNPILPLQVEGDRRIGQDSVVARLFLSENLRLELIESPQDDPDDHRMAARFAVQRREIDAAAMIARIREDYVFGGEFATSVGGTGVRGEGTWTNPDLGDEFWQLVGSVDHNFVIGSGLYVLVEHLFNENRIDPDLPIPTGIQVLALAQAPQLDRLTTVVRHQTGLLLGYDLTPLLRGDLLTLYDWNGASAGFLPTLSYEWQPDLVITIGAQLFIGSDESTEYGEVSNLLLVQLDAYF